MQVRLFDKAMADVPAGTVVTRVYMGGVWHNYRCFVPRDGYFPDLDAERYKKELRSFGVSFPIESICLREPPRDESEENEE